MPRFDTLDSIDWASLRHAYGAASDIPAHLRNLTDLDEEIRTEALYELKGSLAHQGSVYPASLAAIPFLIELVADQTQPQRVEILGLLTNIAQGQSWSDSHYSFIEFLGMNDEAFNEQHEQELMVVTQIKQVLQDQLAFFMELLEDADKQIVRQSLKILAKIQPTDTEQAKVIDVVLNHDNVDYRADCLILLSRWESTHVLSTAHTVFDTTTDDLLKLVATIMSIFHTVPEPIPNQLSAYVGQAIEQHNPTLIKRYESLALANGFWLDLAYCLFCGEPAIRETYIPYFVEAIKDTRNDLDWKAALIVAFGTLEVDPDHVPTPLQRQAVAIIADVAYARRGVVYTNPLRVLDNFGLPSTSRTLDAYLSYPNADHSSLEEISKPPKSE